jgi:hypothetical protein
MKKEMKGLQRQCVDLKETPTNSLPLNGLRERERERKREKEQVVIKNRSRESRKISQF